MTFDPERADIRFGCGLSPQIAPPGSVAEMLDRLGAPDQAARQFPIPTFDAFRPHAIKFAEARSAFYHPKSDAARKKAERPFRARRRYMRQESYRWFGHTMLRRALGPDPMRERLTSFWADHFTTEGRDAITRSAHAIYIEEAIRPHVTGRFGDLLKAAVTHPVMLVYLDQIRSIGPGSPAAQKAAKKKRGLNENLAREVLELHTLGVGGPYTQTDVRQLAELFTGMRYTVENGFFFRARLAEPGPETVLGKSYGGGPAVLADIHEVLDDLAVHPATAAHLARKLAVHFVSDTPDPALVAAMTATYRDTGGDLLRVYETLLSHPAAWDPAPRNVKRPLDFIGSALRALDPHPKHVPTDEPGKILQLLIAPMTLMGQRWGHAPGPDGWPEADEQWITPQRLSARLQWAMSVPYLLRKVLPDPRAFVETALGATAPEAVRFAAGAAEDRVEGVGLVLASPAFQRM